MADETPTKRREPTASEAMFFFAIVKHTRNKADIDWDAVAQEQNFKNADVAKVRFGQVKRKLGIDSNVTPKKTRSNSSPASTSTPSKVRKTPTDRVGTKGKGRGSRAKKEIDEAAAAADAEAGDDTATAVESPFGKEEEDDSFNFKAKRGGDPF